MQYALITTPPPIMLCRSISALVSILFNKNVVWKETWSDKYCIVYKSIQRSTALFSQNNTVDLHFCIFFFLFQCEGVMRTPIYCLFLTRNEVTDLLPFHLEHFLEKSFHIDLCWSYFTIIASANIFCALFKIIAIKYEFLDGNVQLTVLHCLPKQHGFGAWKSQNLLWNASMKGP